jgi:hypothetical protein
MAVRKGTALALALLGLLVAASAAQASYHLMKIREVGQGAVGTGDYVVLQMYANGQNFVGSNSAKIQTYNAAGAVQSTFTFTSDVPFGDSQRTIYVARNEMITFPATPDVITPDLVLTNEGAVCFGQTFGANQAIDCVSYGNFPGVMGGDPSPMGTPAPAPAAGQALLRSITPGCPTLLEASDDTNNSLADFAIAAQNPRNNAAAPTETQCTGGGGGGGTADNDPPQTTITDGPKKRSFKRRISIAFKSSEQDSHFKCRLDGGAFASCQSPFKDRVKRGKHSFEVFAVDQAGNEDRSPARVEFKVKKRRKR